MTPRDTKGRKVAVWVDMSSTEVVEAYVAWLKAEALEDRIPAVPQRDHDGPCFFFFNGLGTSKQLIDLRDYVLLISLDVF